MIKLYIKFEANQMIVRCFAEGRILEVQMTVEGTMTCSSYRPFKVITYKFFIQRIKRGV